MISTILNLDTQENQIFYDSGYSDAPSPGSSSTSSRMMGSPMSQASDGSKYNMMNLYALDEPVSQIGFQKNTSFFSPNVSQGEPPKLVILEEPVDKFRFRYKSEMHGTHGSLMGSSNGKSKKTFPTVELRGYHGRAVIRCSLYQTDALEPSPHSHKLVVRHNDVDVSDPHDLYVSVEEGYRAVFQGMGIIHTAKKHIFEELVGKKIREKKFELGRPLTLFEESNIKVRAEKEAKNMNLNQVRLGFTAYAVNSDDSWSWLCGPVFSRSINNMKSALTGELKISRLSAAVSSAAGGDDLILLVEKVGKKNIKVKFFEVDENDEEIWVDWGIFSEADVHHQYAIALRTPPYKNKDIDKHVDVFIQLFRPSDKDHSEPVPFRYKPRDFVTSRKRARTSSSGLSSIEIPETVITEMHNNIKDSPQQSLSFGSINKSDFIEKLLNENIPPEFEQQVHLDSDELMNYVDKEFFEDLDKLEADGSASPTCRKVENFTERRPERKMPLEQSYVKYFKNICSVGRLYAKTDPGKAKSQILDIFNTAKVKDEDILHNAIIHGDGNRMIMLLKLIDKLELYEVLQYQNEKRQTCLHLACIYDRSEYIRPLINLGTNPNIQDYQGNTALHLAVEDNMLMCASRIIEKLNYTKKSHPLQIDLANDDGLTPLHLAVKKNNLPMIKKLLEIGQASTKLCISKNGNNVLHLAVEQNDKNIVKYLLENTKVNINEQNTSGFTPLRLAYSMGKDAKSVVQLLLEHGATSGSSCGDFSPMEMVATPKSRNTDDSSEEDEYDEKPLQIDEYRLQDTDHLEEGRSLLDDECIEQLKTIFDKDEKWRELAKVLNLEMFVDVWKFTSSPTLAMFNYINVNDILKDKTEQFVNAMEQLGEHEAVNRVWEMLSRRKC